MPLQALSPAPLQVRCGNTNSKPSPPSGMAKRQCLHALRKPQVTVTVMSALRSRQDSLHTTVLRNTEPGVDLAQALQEARAITDFQVQFPKDPSVQLYQAPEPFPVPHLKQETSQKGDSLSCTGSLRF